MLRFLDPKMQPIGLGYMGTIYCVLDSNTRIAVCRGGTSLYGTVSRPSSWDDWEVISNCNEDDAAMLQRLIASAWVANEAVIAYINR